MGKLDTHQQPLNGGTKGKNPLFTKPSERNIKETQAAILSRFLRWYRVLFAEHLGRRRSQFPVRKNEEMHKLLQFHRVSSVFTWFNRLKHDSTDSGANWSGKWPKDFTVHVSTGFVLRIHITEKTGLLGFEMIDSGTCVCTTHRRRNKQLKLRIRLIYSCEYDE